MTLFRVTHNSATVRLFSTTVPVSYSCSAKTAYFFSALVHVTCAFHTHGPYMRTKTDQEASIAKEP